MTKLDKKVNCLVKIVVLLAVFWSGCAPVGEQKTKPIVGKGKPVTIALKFNAGDLTTYKVVTEFKKSAAFEGSLAQSSDLKGGSSGYESEITFDQQIDSVDDAGNATAKITIKALKYSSIVKDVSAIDFDSADAGSNDSSLSKLIGQSYVIEISPSGKFLKLVDAKQARSAIKGTGSARKIATMLLSPAMLEMRHGTMPLPSADKNKLRAGETWSNSKEFEFGLMGNKSYDRVYTIKEIQEKDGKRIASIEMKGIPGSEAGSDKNMGGISKMFDTTDTYEGQLQLDLTNGKIEKYSELAKSEWIVVEQRGDKDPDAIIMGSVRSYSIEKVD